MMDIVEEIALAVKQYLAEHTGFGTDEGEGRVSAYYGGNWITLDTTKIARAAYEVMARGDGELARLVGHRTDIADDELFCVPMRLLRAALTQPSVQGSSRDDK